VSKNRQWLEARGWRLFSRRKHGMYVKERWYHPRDGSKTLNQEEAMRSQREHAKQKAMARA
jgi:hypothetical protein